MCLCGYQAVEYVPLEFHPRYHVSQALMTDETIGNVPILILGNKIDKPEAISEEKLREIFGLYGQTTGKVSGSINSGF